MPELLEAPGELVDDALPDVVAGVPVLRAGIPQPHHDLGQRVASGLLFLFRFLRRGRSFLGFRLGRRALFLGLALGEDFRLGRRDRRSGLGCRRDFLGHRRRYRRDGLARIVDDAHALRWTQVAYGEHVADRQVRDVGVDAPRNVGRQAGHLDLVHDEVEDTLRVAHADGLAHRMHRYAHGDGAVGADLLNVDVHELLGDGIELHVTNDGHPRAAVAVELQRQQLGRALATVDDPQDVAGVDGDGLRRGAAVQDGGHGALAAEAPGGAFARALAALDGDFRRVHRRLLGSFVVTRTGSRRIPRRGSVQWPHRAAASRSGR